MGDSRGNNAGGGRGEAYAVGKQARRGGSNVLGSGDGIYWTIVKGLCENKGALQTERLKEKRREEEKSEDQYVSAGRNQTMRRRADSEIVEELIGLT